MSAFRLPRSGAGLRSALREWLSARDDLRAEFGMGSSRPIAEQVAHEAALLQTLHDAGWTRIGWPESAGGVGGDEGGRAIVYDELAAAGIALPEAFVLLETIAPVLVRFAPELAARHLTAYLTGRQLWCQGFSEPEAGSDLASVRTRASATDGGFTLNGQKIWTTLGQFADMAMVLARTGDLCSSHRGLSMLWVDLGSPGVEIRPIRASDGRDEFAEMYFADVPVPGANLLGDLNGGWAVAMYMLQYERGMYAWLRQAALFQALNQARRTASASNADAVAAMGRAYVSLAGLRARSAGTVARLAGNEELGPEASVDKVLLSRAEQQTYEAVRLAAPDAFLLDDDPAASWARTNWFYSRAASIFGGAVEIQRTIIAERVLGMDRGANRGR
jgi:acyl-CoA dehydrogenase